MLQFVVGFLHFESFQTIPLNKKTIFQGLNTSFFVVCSHTLLVKQAEVSSSVDIFSELAFDLFGAFRFNLQVFVKCFFLWARSGSHLKAL